MRYRVTCTRVEQYQQETVVEAESEAQAVRLAGLDNSVDGWPSMSEVEGDYVDCFAEDWQAEPISPEHEAAPVSRGGRQTECRWCGEPVRWTGTESTGDAPTIPGPWVHVEREQGAA